jgi:hypothetical protein
MPASASGPIARISEPRDGETVRATKPGEPAVPVSVKGTATNLPAGSTAWTVVHHGGSYWPQRRVVPPLETWTGTALIGGSPSDAGKIFDILFVLTDSLATKAFDDWLDEGAKTGLFPGFKALPNGATALTRITVTLR